MANRVLINPPQDNVVETSYRIADNWDGFLYVDSILLLQVIDGCQ